MDREIAILKFIFRCLYGMIIAFIIAMTTLFILSYYNLYAEKREDVEKIHEDTLKLIEMDYRLSGKSTLTDLIVKYGASKSSLITEILFVDENGMIRSASSPETSYVYEGIKGKGDIRLGDQMLYNNQISIKRVGHYTDVLLLTSLDLIKKSVFDLWIKSSRLEFIVGVLLPLIALMALILSEDHLLMAIRARYERISESIEHRISEKLEIYRGLFLHNSSVMLLLEPESGLIIDANEAAHNYYGYNFKKNKIAIQDINRMEPHLIQHAIQNAVSKNQGYFNFKHTLANGEVRDVEVYSGPVIIDEKTMLCSIVHDITDKCLAEEAIRMNQKEMERKIKEKSEILAMISHELKTPMAGIVHNIDDIEGKISRPEQQEDLQFLKYNINSLNRLVFDLLDYSRIETGVLKLYNTPFELKELLEKSVQLFQPIARNKGIDLVISASNLESCSFVGDAFRIGQIVNNLISNSVKYTHKGYIKISAESEKVGQKCRVKISVEDTGIGMRQEVIEQIFMRYFTTDQTGELTGTGLGLSICRQIAEAMGGTLEVTSTLGDGTKMSLTLMLEIDSEESAYMLRQIPVGNAIPCNLLIVDDDSLVPQFLQKLIKQANLLDVVIDSAYNGIEALEMLKSKNYHVIFADHRLPDMEGLTLLSRLNEHNFFNTDTYCVLMSADQVEFDSTMAFIPDAFLVKPFESKTVANIMEKIKEYLVERV